MGVKCSICGAEKGETNHWWIAFVVFQTQLRIDAFGKDPSREREETTLKLCGTNCLHKAVEQHAEYVRNIQ